MCRICKMSLDDEKAVLAAVEKAIKGGADPEHFVKMLDKLLGTEMAERNLDVEEAWENSNRRKKDSL